MKRLLKILQNIFITETPIYIVFFITSFCNAKCKMCFNWKNIKKADTKQELKLNEIKKIFNKFSSIQQLTISGGEPFLRNDLPEILGFVSKKNDVQMITIPTNGILSDKIFEKTKDILNKIKKSTHLRISLPIEGIEEKHDEIVQVKGAFKKVQETYQKLQPLMNLHKNLNIDIVICCSGLNKKYLKDIINYCNEYFKDCNIITVLARGDTRDKQSRSVNYKEYQEVLDYLYQLKNTKKINKPFAGILNVLEKIANYQIVNIIKTKKMPSKCYAYSKMIVLQSDGGVFPCEYLDKKLGDLKDYNYDIKNILDRKDNKKIEEFIKDGKCYCTWECALMNNLVCNPRTYFKIFKRLITSKI